MGVCVSWCVSLFGVGDVLVGDTGVLHGVLYWNTSYFPLLGNLSHV